MAEDIRLKKEKEKLTKRTKKRNVWPVPIVTLLTSLGLNKIAGTTLAGSMALNATLPVVATAGFWGAYADLGLSALILIKEKILAKIPLINKIPGVKTKSQKLDVIAKELTQLDRLLGKNDYKTLNSTQKGQVDNFMQGVKRTYQSEYREIAREIIVSAPNRFQQKLLHNLDFRDLKTDKFNGNFLPDDKNYSLSTVYNALRLRNTLKRLVDEGKNEDSLSDKEKRFINNLKNYLADIGIDEEIIHSEDTRTVLKGVEDYLKPLKSLEEELKDRKGNPIPVLDKDGNPVVDENGKPKIKTGLFLDAYLLRGGKYQNMAYAFTKGNCGYDVLMQLVDAKSIKDNLSVEERKQELKKWQTNAYKIISDIKELGIPEEKFDEKLINVRKVLDHEGCFMSAKSFSALIDDENSLRVFERKARQIENQKINAKAKNLFITPQWIVDALHSNAPGKFFGLTAQQRKLAKRICREAGICGRFTRIKTLQQKIKDTSAFTNDQNELIKQIQRGIDRTQLFKNDNERNIEKEKKLYEQLNKLGDTPEDEKAKKKIYKKLNDLQTGSYSNAFTTQYLVTNNYKLKKFNKPEKVVKQTKKYLPGYEKSLTRNHLAPITRNLFKRVGLRILAGAAAAASLIAIPFVLPLSPLAIAAGAAGAGIGLFTVVDKIQEIRTGKKFIWGRTQLSRQKAEIKAANAKDPSKFFAESRCSTSAHFRNALIKDEAKGLGKIKGLYKRLKNKIGFEDAPKRKQMTGLVSYPPSFMEAYGDNVTNKEAINKCLRNAVKKGLEQRSDVTYLTDPVEIIIRTNKGKIKEAYCIDQKDLAQDMLQTLLKSHSDAIGKSEIFDVHIGETSFRVNQDELKNKKIDGVEENGIESVTTKILGYAKEEQIRRRVEGLYKCVSDVSDAEKEKYGIVLQEGKVKNHDEKVGIVTQGRNFAQIVHDNAVRDGATKVPFRFYKYEDGKTVENADSERKLLNPGVNDRIAKDAADAADAANKTKQTANNSGVEKDVNALAAKAAERAKREAEQRAAEQRARAEREAEQAKRETEQRAAEQRARAEQAVVQATNDVNYGNDDGIIDAAANVQPQNIIIQRPPTIVTPIRSGDINDDDVIQEPIIDASLNGDEEHDKENIMRNAELDKSSGVTQDIIDAYINAEIARHNNLADSKFVAEKVEKDRLARHATAKADEEKITELESETNKNNLEQKIKNAKKRMQEWEVFAQNDNVYSRKIEIYKIIARYEKAIAEAERKLTGRKTKNDNVSISDAQRRVDVFLNNPPYIVSEVPTKNRLYTGKIIKPDTNSTLSGQISIWDADFKEKMDAQKEADEMATIQKAIKAYNLSQGAKEEVKPAKKNNRKSTPAPKQPKRNIGTDEQKEKDLDIIDLGNKLLFAKAEIIEKLTNIERRKCYKTLKSLYEQGKFKDKNFQKTKLALQALKDGCEISPIEDVKFQSGDIRLTNDDIIQAVERQYERQKYKLPMAESLAPKSKKVEPNNDAGTKNGDLSDKETKLEDIKQQLYNLYCSQSAIETMFDPLVLKRAMNLKGAQVDPIFKDEADRKRFVNFKRRFIVTMLLDTNKHSAQVEQEVVELVNSFVELTTPKFNAQNKR